MERKEIVENLKKIDEEASLILSSVGKKYDVIILGGGAFLLKNLIIRATPDIDTISHYNELSNIMKKYDMNSCVTAYCGSLPYNFEDRLESINIKTKVIKYLVLSNEDLALTKISSYRDKDIEDLKSIIEKGQLNFAKLEKIVNDKEMEMSALNQSEIDRFNYNYAKFIKDYKK